MSRQPPPGARPPPQRPAANDFDALDAAARRAPPPGARPGPPPPAGRGAPPPSAGPPRGPPPQMQMQQPPPQQQPRPSQPPSAQQPMQRPPLSQQQQPPPQMQPRPSPPPAAAAAAVPVRKPAPPPAAPADEDEVEEDYGDDDFDEVDDDTPAPVSALKPAAAAAPSYSAQSAAAPAKPAPAPPAAALPSSSALQQMVAAENKSLAAPGPQQRSAGAAVGPSITLGSNLAGTATLSAQSASPVPVRKYVPISSKAQRVSAASSKDNLKKDARARAILKQVSLSVERFDSLFILDPMTPADLHAREVRRGIVRDMGSQYNADWVSRDVQTEETEEYSLGIQVPDDRNSTVVGRREAASATSTGTSTSTSTGTDPMPALSSAAGVSTTRLTKFVASAGMVMESLLMEEGSSTGHFRALNAGAAGAAAMATLSAASLSLVLPAVFGRSRRINDVVFSAARAQTLLVVYSPCADDSERAPGGSVELASKGLVVLWDLSSPSYPSKLLYCDGSPTTVGVDVQQAAASSAGGGIVFAGLEAGSLALWDLREDAAHHRSMHVPNAATDGAPSETGGRAGHTYILRAASFITANNLRENHSAPVRRVLSLGEHSLKHLALSAQGSSGVENALANFRAQSKAAAAGDAAGVGEGSGATFDVMSLSAHSRVGGVAGSGAGGAGAANFQFASLDESGGLQVWTGIELQDVDPAGSEADLGLAPGARVKLVRTAVLRDGSLSAGIVSGKSKPGAVTSLGVQSFDVAFKPDETNEFVIASGKGEGKSHPSDYHPSPSGVSIGDDCVCLSYSPYYPSWFLAGFRSGAVSLFNIDCSNAMQSWFNLFPSAGSAAGGGGGGGSGVARVAWSSSRPSVFFAGDASGRLVVFDLLKSSQKPLVTVQLPMASAGAAMAGSGALPTPFDADPSSTSAQAQALMAMSAAVPGAAPQQLSQSMIAFPAAAAAGGQQQQQPTVEVHLLKPNLSLASDKERQQFAEYLQHVHTL